MSMTSNSVDLSSDVLSDIRESFETKYLINMSGQELEKGVIREFYDHGFRPLARKTMNLATSIKMGLGDSKTEVARQLGMERTRASDAHLRGDMRLSTYASIKYSKRRLMNIDVTEHDIRAMNRAGFIGVANYLRTFVNDRSSPKCFLREFEYELVCEMVRSLKHWSILALSPDVMGKVFLIQSAVKLRDCKPEWYSKEELAAVDAVLGQAMSSEEAALEFLTGLFREWHDIFICAAFQIDEAELGYSLDPASDEESDCDYEQ